MNAFTFYLIVLPSSFLLFWDFFITVQWLLLYIGFKSRPA